MRHYRRLLILVLALFTTGAGSLVYGQAAKASISGTVTDVSKAVIHGARVVVTPGNIVTTTNAAGRFTLNGLAPGTYTLTITSTGFGPLSESVTLNAGQSQTVSLSYRLVPRTSRWW